MIMPENLQNAGSHEITIYKPLQVCTTKTLWLPTWRTNCVPQMLKKWRIIVNRISKVRQTTCNWIKKIFDEATRTIVNVFFYILILLFVLIMFNKLTCKVRFDIAIWSLSKCYKSVLESVKNQSLSSEICSGSSHKIGRSLPIVFQQNWLQKFLQNSREIGRFFSEFVPENPTKFDFFLRDLSEALSNGLACN